jgi:DNA (cytosine-5)-methyltransferase 1
MENSDLAHKPLTFGSLFAGIGGFDLGLERAGMECKWQVEIDEYASKVLAKHWPNIHRWDDVCTWPQPNTEYVDVICGGFPCQDISYAGKGAGLDGERSGLWFEFARVVREMGPRAVAVENVAALLTRGLDEVLGTLASLGYDAEWDCIPAAAVGAPHIRDRVFVLGWNADCKHDSSIGSGSKENANTGRDCNRKNKDNSDSNTNSLRCQKQQKLYSQPKRTINSPLWSDVMRLRQFSHWQVEPAVGRVADGIPNRSHRLRGLGNAIVPQVAEVIGRRIVQKLNP